MIDFHFIMLPWDIMLINQSLIISDAGDKTV